jgi:tRNA uridine 5-carboxymethylaminomethyl modification enzyme
MNVCGVDENCNVEECLKTKYVSSVTTRLGETWKCDCVIVASGTYLESSIFVGDVNYEAGPDGFLPSKGLSASLEAAGIRLLRFKTGTPARIKRESIDFSVLEEQPGESPIQPYASSHQEGFFDNLEQISCHIVYTNSETHRIIRENIGRSAMYSGKIHGTGPRYCPSIEDKLVRFADKERHQLFVEPVGADTSEIYLQGFSTSLPTDVQIRMLHSLRGFENAEIMRYAYAIEYDCADPLQMDATLEFKNVKGLFGAGQFNGTSGYEEAAAQGLVAGINAARKVKALSPIILPRSGSYIGTLIDDLVTKGTNEPYRMMTSRSEYRLLLRQDNADLRLTEIGYEAGLVFDEQYRSFLAKKEAQEQEKMRLETTFVSPERANPLLEELGETPLKSGASLADLLRRPAVSYAALGRIDAERPILTRASALTVETDVKYAGYANRQLAEIEQRKKLDEKLLPENVNYSEIRGLRLEAAQKLSKIQPRTIGQASRISGVNPADITVLLIHFGMK